MGDKTGITWTDHTFNPWIGCTKVSAGCDHCYAETLAIGRMQRKWGPGAPRVRTGEKNWHEPLRWNKQAFREGVRHKVFCASLADVFDAEVPQAWREDLWALIRATQALDWQLLTKRTRAKWIEKCLPADWGNGYPNVWLGSSVEDQETYDRRVPELLSVPAKIHWLSSEPQIGPIWPSHDHLTRPRRFRAEYGIPGIDWVVVGGESGKGARPMQTEWLQDWINWGSVFDVPIFFKQWGDASSMRQEGVHHGGDLLDGKQVHEFPNYAR